MNREDIENALTAIKKCTEEIKTTLEPEYAEQTLKEIVDQNIKGLIFKKLEKEIADNLGHLSLKELIEALELFNEKPKEKQRPSIVRNFGTPKQPEPEVRPEPPLEPSPKPSVRKDGKGHVPKRV